MPQIYGADATLHGSGTTMIVKLVINSMEVMIVDTQETLEVYISVLKNT